jgi:hypothetical protein
MTLSDETTVDANAIKANQFEPGIAIAPNGHVHVAWYDFKNSPTNMFVTTGHSGDTGISDVYYASSSDHGSTWSAPLRVNDRGIDRSKGVWSNNIDSKFNVGIAATDDDVFFAWQDTRNAIGETGSEDIYTSSLPLEPIKVGDSGSGIPGWSLLLTGLFGLGLGVGLTSLMMRRSAGAAAAAAPAPARVPNRTT